MAGRYSRRPLKFRERTFAMEEIWKDIVGYEGLYQISNLGNVKSLNWRGHGYPKNLTPKLQNSGRYSVQLTVNGKSKYFLVHRLVAAAFIPNPFGYSEINHIDENPRNNDVRNLEWCEHLYNVRRYLENHPEHHKTRRTTEKYGKRLGLPIFQLDLSGNIIHKWNNSREICVQTGMSDWSISECCRGNRNTAYGYKWRYAS